MLMMQYRAQWNNVNIICNLHSKNEMSANSTKWQMVLLFKELDYKPVSSDKMT